MSLWRRMSGEQRSTEEPITWNRMLELFSSGSVSHAGVNVTPQSALTFSAVFGCRRAINTGIGPLPLGLFRARGEVRERIRDDYRDALMRRSPYPGIRRTRWRMTLQDHALSWGNGVAVKEFGRDHNVSGLKILPPDRTEIETEAGKTKYWYQPPKGKRRVYFREEVFHLAGMGFDGIRGYSVIECARQAIGKGLAADKYSAEFYKRGARHDLVGTTPKRLSDSAYQRLKNEIATMARGESYGTLILEEGAEVKTVSIPQRDSQWLEGQKFGVEEICRFYGVPKSRVQEDSQTQPRANREEDNRVFIEDTLASWLTVWEEELAETLLTQAEEEAGYYWRHNLSALLRGDAKARAEIMKARRMSGMSTADEERALEEWNPLGGTAGETVWMPINMVPVKPGEDVAPQVRSYLEALGPAAKLVTGNGHDRRELPSAPEERETVEISEEEQRAARTTRSAEERLRLRNAFIRLFEQAAGRWIGRELSQLRRLIERAFAGETPVETLGEGLEEIYSELPEVVAREWLPVLTSFAALLREAIDDEGYTVEDDASVDSFLSDRAGLYGEHYAAASRGQLEALVGEGGESEAIQERLTTRVDEWAETRAGKEARRGSVFEAGAAAVFLYSAAGVQFLVWRAFGQSCPFCSQLNGQRTRAGSTFVPVGTVLGGDAPDVTPLTITRSLPHAPAHDGCDCTVVPA